MKPADLVTVIQDEEDRPSAELIRQVFVGEHLDATFLPIVNIARIASH